MKVYTAIYGPADAAARTSALRDMGVSGVFTFEGPHDVFTPLTLASTVGGMDLLTNVAIAFPRNPIHLAHQANDLQLLSSGRFALGLGTQIRPQIEKRFGIEFGHPARRMTELVAAVRAIFDRWNNGTPLDFRGEYYRHTLMTPTFDPGPNPFGPPPVYVGGLGPRMTRAAAEVADGLLVMPFNSARYLRERILPSVAEGLAAGGRDATAFRLIPEVIVAVAATDAERERADAAARKLLGFYGSTPAYRPVLELHGWGDLQTDLNALSKQGRWQDMARLIDDDILSTIAARGTPAEVAADIMARVGTLADRVCFYQPYAPSDETMAELVGHLIHPH